MSCDRNHVGFVFAGSATIATSLATCPHPARCLQHLTNLAVLPHLLCWVVASLCVITLGAWLALLCFVLARAQRAVGRLIPVTSLPARLRASIARTGVRRVRCVAGGTPAAFCTGALRPTIVVSEGLTQRLQDRELDAVLLHEYHHARQREPLVRTAAETAARVLFFFPLLRWWSQWRTEEAELQADEAAVRRLGPQAVAAALCALGTGMPAAAAFAGAAELRVAQLLGDPLPVRRPSLALVVLSVLGVAFALLVFGCVVGRLLGMGLGGVTGTGPAGAG